MLPHHEAAAAAATARLRADPEVLAIYLGGSIAKGLERPGSDVDLLAIVDDDSFERRLHESRCSFLWTDLAGWEGGYVEGRFLSRSFIDEAATRGSEPTRWAFIGASRLWGEDEEIEAAIGRIPVYPKWDQERRIVAFLAQLKTCKFYFWPEGVRRQDAYLHTWAAVQIVLFAGRCILAVDEMLFPNQKRLMETVITAPSCPPEFKSLAEWTLALDESARDALYESVLAVTGDRPTELLLSRFEADSEMSWFTRSHDVAEW